MNKVKVFSSLVVVSLGLATHALASATSVSDPFYPAQESSELSSMTIPHLNSASVGYAELVSPGDSPRKLAIGDRYGDWELVAILEGPAPLVVLERDFPEWGVLAYVGQSGPVITLRKAVGNLEGFQKQKKFPAGYAEHLLTAQQDVLGNQLRSSGQEASYGALASLLPPLDTYTFLGTTTSHEKLIVWQDGRLGFGIHNHDLGSVLFDPAEALHLSGGDSRLSKEGLVGGYLPVIDYGFVDPKSTSGWEELAVSVGQDDLTTYVSLRSTDGKRTYWKLHGGETLSDGADFYRELLGVQKTWAQFFAKGMQLQIPEQRVDDASKASIVRALISEVGLHPKYGVGSYGEPEHDTFPPTTIQLNLCLLDWGFTDEVKARLGYYLSNYVKKDGTIDYYGPAISEYGQLLTLAARYVQVTGDTRWMDEHRPELERIAGYLSDLLDASRSKFAPGSEDYGLLRGAGEADTSSDQRFYFSGNVWCWRGLLDFSQLLREEGTRSNNAQLVQAAANWSDKASEIQAALTVSLKRSLDSKTTPPFLSPVAGSMRPFSHMTESEFASYTNYRYWLEMLSPSFLSADMSKAIIDYRRAHGGELAGTTRFEDHLDDWTYANYAWGLLEGGDVEHYLLGFYGHLAYHQTPGTFTAYEQVAIRGESARSYVADYCVPSELVTPQMLRWMLVWEPWEKQELWLSTAVPKSWLQVGFAAHRVPTRWGHVSIEEQQTADGLKITIDRERAAKQVAVYIPMPSANIRRPHIVVAGTKDWQWDAMRSAIKLQGDWTRVSLNIKASE